MFEIIGIVFTVYFIIAVLTFVVLNTLHSTWNKQFEFLLSIILSIFWIIILPIIFNDQYQYWKRARKKYE